MKKRLGELWHACSLTDRIIAVFTVVLAVASCYQFSILNGQLTAMRKEARAWMEARVSGEDPNLNRPIQVKVLPLNAGKTAAKRFQATMRLEIVDSGSEPTFDYSNPLLNTWAEGNLIPPNQPWITSGIDAKRQVVGTQATEPIVFNEDLRERFLTGNIWFSAEGRITYEDVFGVEHWLTFAWPNTLPLQACGLPKELRSAPNTITWMTANQSSQPVTPRRDGGSTSIYLTTRRLKYPS